MYPNCPHHPYPPQALGQAPAAPAQTGGFFVPLVALGLIFWAFSGAGEKRQLRI